LPEAYTIWCISDNKPGHRSQLQGLVEALSRCGTCHTEWLQPGPGIMAAAAALSARPQLLLCAGHGTHWPAIRLRWRYGGLLVVLLKPSLPRQLFDLCVIPEHDRPRAGPRVLPTCGTINDIRPAKHADPERGLILIGGPSRHHGWNDQQMQQQIGQLCEALPEVSWTLTTSRRTPDSFLAAVEKLAGPRLAVIPAAETNRDWLRRHYAQCGVIWVSEDSASMVYEALTAGAAVGILPVPRHRSSRVSRGLDELLARGMASTLSEVREAGQMPRQGQHLQEADRVAEQILEHLNRREAAGAT
jgi:mitochondrial fission protein ELM1